MGNLCIPQNFVTQDKICSSISKKLPAGVTRLAAPGPAPGVGVAAAAVSAALWASDSGTEMITPERR